MNMQQTSQSGTMRKLAFIYMIVSFNVASGDNRFMSMPPSSSDELSGEENEGSVVGDLPKKLSGAKRIWLSNSIQNKFEESINENTLIDGHLRNLYDYTSSYNCDGYSCECGKGCTTTCYRTCYYYWTYCTAGRYWPGGARSSTSTAAVSCNACPGGRYEPATRQSSCRYTCPAGYYCPAGSSGISACPGGYYCPSSSDAYYSCPAGNFCPAYSSSLRSCPGGRYEPTARQTSCRYTCPAGYYCPSGSVSYLGCPTPGTYCPAGSSAILNCPVGQYNTQSYQSSCFNCQGGRYTSSPGGTSCLTCPQGYYCPEGVGAVACPSGYYCLLNATTSTPCPAGYYCPSLSTSYSICSAGQYSNVYASSCTTCSSGKYQSSPGQSFCSECPTGKHQRRDDYTKCVNYSIPSPQPTNSFSPSPSPTRVPTPLPTIPPTYAPTRTYRPTLSPSLKPTRTPSLPPTFQPTAIPSFPPSPLPTIPPSFQPTQLPTILPTPLPTLKPSPAPSALPTIEPTSFPTHLPTEYGTMALSTDLSIQVNSGDIPTAERKDIVKQQLASVLNISVDNIFSFSLEVSSVPSLLPTMVPTISDHPSPLPTVTNYPSVSYEPTPSPSSLISTTTTSTTTTTLEEISHTIEARRYGLSSDAMFGRGSLQHRMLLQQQQRVNITAFWEITCSIIVGPDDVQYDDVEVFATAVTSMLTYNGDVSADSDNTSAGGDDDSTNSTAATNFSNVTNHTQQTPSSSTSSSLSFIARLESLFNYTMVLTEVNIGVLTRPRPTASPTSPSLSPTPSYQDSRIDQSNKYIKIDLWFISVRLSSEDFIVVGIVLFSCCLCSCGFLYYITLHKKKKGKGKETNYNKDIEMGSTMGNSNVKIDIQRGSLTFSSSNKLNAFTEKGDGLTFPGKFRSQYAVKVYQLQQEFTQVTSQNQALRSELRALASLDHGVLLRYYGMCEYKGFTCLVYEDIYEAGKESQCSSLASYYPTDKFTELEFYRIGSEMLGALSYLHSKKVAHHALKPEIVFLKGAKRTVKITEFALTKCQLTDFVSSVYLAPELISHATTIDSVDEYKVDVYATAILLCELLAKTKPFHYTSPSSSSAASDIRVNETNTYDLTSILNRVYEGERPDLTCFFQQNGGERTEGGGSGGGDACSNNRSKEQTTSPPPVILSKLITDSWNRYPHKRPTMEEMSDRFLVASHSLPMNKYPSSSTLPPALSSSKTANLQHSKDTREAKDQHVLLADNPIITPPPPPPPSQSLSILKAEIHESDSDSDNNASEDDDNDDRYDNMLTVNAIVDQHVNTESSVLNLISTNSQKREAAGVGNLDSASNSSEYVCAATPSSSSVHAIQQQTRKLDNRRTII